MTHEELIAKARAHTEPFERMPSDAPPLREFSVKRVRDAVMIYFNRPGADDRFEICLDRETGDFLGSVYVPKSKPKRGDRVA